MGKPKEREKYFVLSSTRFVPATEAPYLCGRLVRRVDEPINGGYAPEDPRPYYVGNHAVTHLADAKSAIVDSEERQLRIDISKAFRLHWVNEAQLINKINGPITIVTIRQQQNVFDKLSKSKSEDIQKEIRKLMEGQTKLLYMIVGYIQLGGPAIVSTTDIQHTEVDFSGNLPLGTVAAAAGAPPVLGRALNVNFGANYNVTQGHDISGTATQGDICAIAYTAIRRESRFHVPAMKWENNPNLDDRVRLNFGSHGYGSESLVEEGTEEGFISEWLFDEDYKEAVGNVEVEDIDDFDLVFSK
jgi:hypothetical protein